MNVKTACLSVKSYMSWLYSFVNVVAYNFETSPFWITDDVVLRRWVNSWFFAADHYLAVCKMNLETQKADNYVVCSSISIELPSTDWTASLERLEILSREAVGDCGGDTMSSVDITDISLAVDSIDTLWLEPNIEERLTDVSLGSFAYK